MLKTCPSCSKSFNAPNSAQIRCSHSCDSRSRPSGGKVAAQCVACGADFERWPYDVGRKACSPTCRRDARRGERPNARKRPQRPCDTCGTAFWPRSDTQRFCSHLCYAAHLTTISGAAHPMWQGGQAPRPDLGKAAWLRLRKRLISEAGYRCTQCGEHKSRLIVHHIIGHREGPEMLLDEANLRVVCQACHNRIHNPVAVRWARYRQAHAAVNIHKRLE